MRTLVALLFVLFLAALVGAVLFGPPWRRRRAWRNPLRSMSLASQ